jgi:hypothetical protein
MLRVHELAPLLAADSCVSCPTRMNAGLLAILHSCMAKAFHTHLQTHSTLGFFRDATTITLINFGSLRTHQALLSQINFQINREK